MITRPGRRSDTLHVSVARHVAIAKRGRSYHIHVSQTGLQVRVQILPTEHCLLSSSFCRRSQRTVSFPFCLCWTAQIMEPVPIKVSTVILTLDRSSCVLWSCCVGMVVGDLLRVLARSEKSGPATQAAQPPYWLMTSGFCSAQKRLQRRILCTSMATCPTPWSTCSQASSSSLRKTGISKQVGGGNLTTCGSRRRTTVIGTMHGANQHFRI